MSTQYHVPQPPAPPAPEPQRSGATKPLMIIFAVLGGLIVLGIVVATLFSSVFVFSKNSAALSTDVNGVTQVQVEANAANFDVVFANISEATLEADGVNAGRWELTRNGNALIVEAPNRWWPWCFFDCDDQQNTVTLTLPQQLNNRSVDAEFEVNAGRFSVTGNFKALDLELNAGELTFDGGATSVDTQVNAGKVNLRAQDVTTADFEVAVGQIEATLTGTPPTNTTVDVAAGQVVLNVPDESYRVTTEAAAGNISNHLHSASDAPHQISVEVAAGDVTLNPNSSQTDDS